MVDELHAQVLQDALQLRGEDLVLVAGLGLSSGVGVGQDQGRGVRLEEEEADQLAGIDGGPVDRTLGEPDESEEVPAGVQRDGVEPFDGLRIEEPSEEELGLLHRIHGIDGDREGVTRRTCR